MSISQRIAVRAAIRIHEQLSRCRQQPPAVRLPTYYWDECQALIGNMDHARRREWNAAASDLQQRLSATLDTLQSCLHGVCREAQKTSDQTLLSASEIYA